MWLLKLIQMFGNEEWKGNVYEFVKLLRREKMDPSFQDLERVVY